MVAVAAHGVPQLLGPVPGGRHRLDDRRAPVPQLGEVEHRLEVPTGLAGAGTVGLVDDEQVGDLHQAGLVGLDGVAPPRVEDHQRGVGGRGHGHLLLSDPDGLDQDQRQADGAEDPEGVGDGGGQATQVAAGGHRPDEDLLVEGVVLHPDPVAQDGAAGEGRRRVDGQYGHPVGAVEPPGPGLGDQPVGQRRLAGPGGAGDAHRVAGARGAVGVGGHGPGTVPPLLDERQEPGQGHPVAGQRGGEQGGGVGVPGDGHGATSVSGRPGGQARATWAPREASFTSNSS